MVDTNGSTRPPPCGLKRINDPPFAGSFASRTPSKRWLLRRPKHHNNPLNHSWFLLKHWFFSCKNERSQAMFDNADWSFPAVENGYQDFDSFHSSSGDSGSWLFVERQSIFHDWPTVPIPHNLRPLFFESHDWFETHQKNLKMGYWLR